MLITSEIQCTGASRSEIFQETNRRASFFISTSPEHFKTFQTKEKELKMAEPYGTQCKEQISLKKLMIYLFWSISLYLCK